MNCPSSQDDNPPHAQSWVDARAAIVAAMRGEAAEIDELRERDG